MLHQSEHQTETRRWLAWTITVALIVFGTLIGVQFPTLPPVPETMTAQGVTNLNSLHLVVPTTQATATPGVLINNSGLGKAFAIQDASTPVVSVNDGGGLTVDSGGLTVTAGGLTLSDGDAVVADDLRISTQASITVTNGAAFTPTGTYQGITAAGEVTPTITAGATDGDLLILINLGTNEINIEDSGTAKLTAVWEGGQYDVLVLWSDGTNWIEISRANN